MATTIDKLAFVSVKDPQFGAKGDGSTDDRAAIQAAFDYARNRATGFGALGVTVYFPHGEYRISAPLEAGIVNITGDSRGSRIRALTGFGPAQITRLYGSTNYTFDSPLLLVDGIGGGGNVLTEISNLFLDGAGVAPLGILTTRQSQASLRNLRILNTVLDGLVVDAIQNSTFINLWISDNGRHNVRLINGLGWCSFIHLFLRAPETTNLKVENDATYPGDSYGGKLPKNTDIVWIGGLMEGEKTAGQKTHCAHLVSVDRMYIQKTQFYSPAAEVFVKCQGGATGAVFEDCSWQTGSVPALITVAERTALIRPSFWNWSGTTNVIESSGVDGLYVERPYYNNVTTSGKYVAYLGATSADKTRDIVYTPLRQGGSNSNRPTSEMQKVDAVAQFWTRDGNKPIWWDPIAGNWKDATGTVA